MSRPRKNPLFITKVCEGCHGNFTISSRKYRQRFCTKSCAQHTPAVLKKMEESKQKTYDEKYNGLHPMQTEKTKNAFKKTLFEKYGDDYFKNYLVKKSKHTNLERYGDENYNNKEQSKKTCQERYGVNNYAQTEDYKNKSRKTCLEKYNTEYPSQSSLHKEKYKKTIFDRYELTDRFKNFTPLFDIHTYNGVLEKIKYHFICKRCGQTILCDLYGGKFPVCFKCDKNSSSFPQKEIYDFLKEELGKEYIILTNDRTLLYPKEIDIYIPHLKLAIEYNGTFWHSEISGNKNKTYHLNKSNRSLSKEVKLIHIFENDWSKKKEIVKSILRWHLKSFSSKIFARKCKIEEIDHQTCKVFLNDNHIQGEDRASIRLGLYYENILISVMTFCKSRYDKKCEYEMSRFCSKLNTTVIGGASKLFAFFLKKHNPISVVSYSDRKYFDGNVYLKLGFKFVNHTSPCYYYIDQEYKRIFNRMQFQKHKLPKLLEQFNPILTEWENMRNNGFDRIWDCGNSKWIWKNIH